MTTTDLYVLEWSQRQNCFHIQPLERTLSFNRGLYQDNIRTVNDYRPIHVGTREECDKAADACRGTLQERDAEVQEVRCRA